MTNVTITLEDQVAQDLQARARTEGLNVEEWIERLVRRHFHPEWPESVRALVGAWPDAPTAEELRQSHGQDPLEDLEDAALVRERAAGPFVDVSLDEL